ncbi:hypothetical protein E2C01_000129 [Portunus trituberculatus]|uniref:Uncharacterized protein n=1 Tax=Portunus trituberculatus TaxID=210409 RepID=A0A5B7CE34_PORTR|nr:hypothetical protein [Portunus trituberculatus]
MRTVLIHCVPPFGPRAGLQSLPEFEYQCTVVPSIDFTLVLYTHAPPYSILHPIPIPPPYHITSPSTPIDSSPHQFIAVHPTLISSLQPFLISPIVWAICCTRTPKESRRRMM